MHHFLIVISGPTGVGKSDFAIQLAHEIDGHIINADVGQFYVPLTIGTAKPDWKHESVPHHLFDILERPEDFSAYEYRKYLMNLLPTLWNECKMPLLVGGSLFYLKSVFFPPEKQVDLVNSSMLGEHVSTTQDLWEQLFLIDPVRAQQLHRHDYYRIQRALDIWYKTGKKPSECELVYDPPSPFIFIFLTRDRADLYKRINQRTTAMINHGWIDEVRLLMNTQWEDFLKTKKIIGYNEIINYIKQGEDGAKKQPLIDEIAQKTRNYAKRQLTFWKHFEKQLQQGITMTQDIHSKIYTLNLTLDNSTLYIEQLNSIIKKMRSYEC